MSHTFAIGVEQNIRENNLLARFGREKIDIDRVTFRDTILLATGLDDCECHGKIFCGKSRAK